MQLTPAQQQALDDQQALTGQRTSTALGMGQRVQDSYSNPMDWSGLPQGGSYVDPNQVQSRQITGSQVQAPSDVNYAGLSRDPRWDQAGMGVRGDPQSRYSQTGFDQPTTGMQGSVGGNRPDTLFGFNNSAGPLQSSFAGGSTGMQSNVQGGPLDYGASSWGIQRGVNGAGQGIQGAMNNTAGGWRQTAQDAVNSLQDPYIAQHRAATETQLANQGITRGSEAWNNAQRELGDAEARARLQAIASGRDEANMLFGQDLSSAQFVNSAQNQGFGQNLAAGQFANQAQAQDFGQSATNVGLNNAAQGQAFNQGAFNATLANQVNQQEYNQNLGQAQFANQANQQGFNQALTGAQFGNEAIQGDFNRNLAGSNLANQVNQQQYNQGLGAGQFANQAQQTNYAQDLAGAQFRNQAQQQIYNQVRDDVAYNDTLTTTDLNNQINANTSNLNNQIAAGGFNTTNDLAVGGFNQANDLAVQQGAINAGTFNNTNQNNAANLAMAQRNQPLNELNSLLTGQQVQQPSFPVPGQASGGQATNYMGAANAGYQGQLDVFGTEQAQRDSNVQAGTSLAAAYLGYLAASDIRVKTDIVYRMTLPNGIRVYSFRYKEGNPLGLPSKQFHMGVIAQEVQEIIPEAVVEGEDGILRVFYNRIFS